jgi:hypothetical protein
VEPPHWATDVTVVGTESKGERKAERDAQRALIVHVRGASAACAPALGAQVATRTVAVRDDT